VKKDENMCDITTAAAANLLSLKQVDSENVESDLQNVDCQDNIDFCTDDGNAVEINLCNAADKLVSKKSVPLAVRKSSRKKLTSAVSKETYILKTNPMVPSKPSKRQLSISKKSKSIYPKRLKIKINDKELEKERKENVTVAAKKQYQKSNS